MCQTIEMSNEETPKKNKGGRPKKSETDPGVGGNHRGKRDQSVRLAEVIRNNLDPQIIYDFYLAQLMGICPVIVRDNRFPGGLVVKPDPSPSAQTPTLEQRNAAMRELTNRSEGLAPQSIEINAQFKAQLNLGIDQSLLMNLETQQLAAVAQQLALILGPKDTNDAELILGPKDTIDAEFIDVKQLQEPSQDETETDKS
jgi:hypothetical protein